MITLPSKNGVFSWHIVNFTPDQPKHKTLLALEKAFQHVSDSMPTYSFKSTKSKEQATMVIEFLDEYERDNKHSMAYAYYPHANMSGHMFLNDNFLWWDVWDGDMRPLLDSLIHEIYHMLGLGHVKDRNCVMYEKNYKWRPLTLCDKQKEALWIMYDIENRQRIDIYTRVIRTYIPKQLFRFLPGNNIKWLAKVFDTKEDWRALHDLIYI